MAAASIGSSSSSSSAALDGAAATSTTISRFTCVEFPGYFDNVQSALNLLGGDRSVEECRNGRTRMLACTLRPEDPLSHPLYADLVPTNNLLIKVTRKKRKRSPSSDRNVVEADSLSSKNEDAKVEILGTVSSTFRFQGLADFQFLPPDGYDSNRYALFSTDPTRQQQAASSASSSFLEGSSSSSSSSTQAAVASLALLGDSLANVVSSPLSPIMNDAVILSSLGLDGGPASPTSPIEPNNPSSGPTSSAADAEPLHIPPPTFSRFDEPRFYKFRQNPFGTFSRDEHGRLLRTVRTSRVSIPKRSYEHAAPSEPPAGLLDNLDKQPELADLVAKLRRIFNHRPVWTMILLQAMLNRQERRGLKSALPMVSYNFTSGAWRGLHIRYGFDPRLDPASAKLQVMNVGLKGFQRDRLQTRQRECQNQYLPRRLKDRHMNFHSTGSSSSSTSQGSAAPSSSQRFRDSPDPWTLFPLDYIELFDVFFSMPRYRGPINQIFLQWCDISDEYIQRLIRSPDEKACTRRTGWLTKETTERLRLRVKHLLNIWLSDPARGQQPPGPPPLSPTSLLLTGPGAGPTATSFSPSPAGSQRSSGPSSSFSQPWFPLSPLSQSILPPLDHPLPQPRKSILKSPLKDAGGDGGGDLGELLAGGKDGSGGGPAKSPREIAKMGSRGVKRVTIVEPSSSGGGSQSQQAASGESSRSTGFTPLSPAGGGGASQLGESSSSSRMANPLQRNELSCGDDDDMDLRGDEAGGD